MSTDTLRFTLSPNLSISRITHGHWRLNNWNYSPKELDVLINNLVEIGVTTFDHADIYGDYSCEEIFGKTLNQNPALRHNIEIITKCGIKLLSAKFPERKIKYYDYSYDHIVNSVEASLRNFNTDYIDLLLLHRPAPFFNPEEVAKAFSALEKSGKVKAFGVSNFLPGQFEMLQSFTEQKLVTNQIEISPINTEHLDNGNIDFLIKQHVIPMAWSPLGGGSIFSNSDERSVRLNKVLNEIAMLHSVKSVETIIYAWLLNHPSNIVPIVGSSKFERVKTAVEAQNINLTTEEWYQIYIASKGHDVP